MRVRHLQSHLAEQGLVLTANLESLSGIRIIVDAAYWLRSIQALKDPFANALGGVLPCIFGCVDRELEHFRMYNISPVFVFQGMGAVPEQSTFRKHSEHKLELAWTLLAKGHRSEAQSLFSVSTSRINSDLLLAVFHHLRRGASSRDRRRGYEILQAPYLAAAQIAHMIEQEVVPMVFGPHGLLLYGVPRVITSLDFEQGTFDWTVMSFILSQWQISKEQFMEACMIAGTDYCLTYPYLDLGVYQQQSTARFNFEAAVTIIKQAPLIEWMQSFPTEEMQDRVMEGYCICKVLLQSAPVYHLGENAVRPLGSMLPGTASPNQPPPGGPVQVPYDFAAIMGEQLPSALYYLILAGIISHKLPQALAKGQWVGKTPPVVDTLELTDLVGDLAKEYRQTSLGLVARHLHPSFMRKSIVCKTLGDQQVGRQKDNPCRGVTYIKPRRISKGLRWKIMADKVDAEMLRQGVDKVDLKFALTWHANEFNREGQLFRGLTKQGESSCECHRSSLSALVHFSLVEHLGLVADDGCITMAGTVLKDIPRCLQEPGLTALEMMKFGVLTAKPFDPAALKGPFPEGVRYPESPVDAAKKSTLLLSRVMSLVPMKLRNEQWNADVDFDLAAFHSLVKVLKRELRMLLEASLASVLLKDMSLVKLLPEDFMCGTPRKKDHLQSPAMFPTFLLSGACMGIVVLFFLRYTGDPADFERELTQRFPCCAQPKEDLMTAFLFWEELRRCVEVMADPLGTEDLLLDMEIASEALERQQQRLGVFPENGRANIAQPPWVL